MTNLKALMAVALSLLMIGLYFYFSTPDIDQKFESAYARMHNNTLTVGTGRIERVWRVESNGLSTQLIKNIESGKEWKSSSDVCDWSLVSLTEGDAELLSITAEKSNDENFTSDHISVIAEFYYPYSDATIQYHIWAYPDAPGLRTQLYVKGKQPTDVVKDNSKSISHNIIDGEPKRYNEANKVAHRNFASVIDGDEGVEIEVSGLDLTKKYKMGVTLWSFERSSLTQSITMSSIDGESRATLDSNIAVPCYGGNKALPIHKIYDLPIGILPSETMRIKIEGTDKFATISELFIYEEGMARHSINGANERVDAIRKMNPSGFSLVSYLNCSDETSGGAIPYNGYIDRLPINAKPLKRSYIGYYNDTQHRNTIETPLIKEETSSVTLDADEINDWSNIVAIDNTTDNSGIIMVKESHKCVNQYGVDTGDFTITDNGVYNTGLGLSLSDIKEDEFGWCWASWSVIYSGDEVDRQLALKQFDRARYPIDKTRDIYIQANTWGSGSNQAGAKQESVLRELEVQAELGVDIQQIDDGWQVSYKDWSLRSDWYPQGWSIVRQRAEELGVKLGLWGAAMPITLDVLNKSFDEGGFVSYKLDFAHLGNHTNMDALITKIRDFVKYTGHKVRVNWDLTENAPRFGYFWAKEYGCVYLENRKPIDPVQVVYIPSLVLRDCWQLAKYTNINKFQTSIQNCAMTNPNSSDAYLHTQSYATAIGLSGVPLLFMETQFLDRGARDEMKYIFSKYKYYRNEIFESYAFPIGDLPDNKSWTGFQYVHKDGGYLLIFREINNKSKSHKMKLEYVKNKRIQLINTMTGECTIATVDGGGYVQFEIENSGDFRLYRYNIE